MSEFGQIERQPIARIRSASGDDPLHALDLLRPAGNHGQFAVETLQIKPAHHAVVRLLDQGHARTGFQLLFDQSEFPLRESEALRVLVKIGIGVRKKDFSRCLFDQSAADRAVQYIARALRREAHDGIEFSPRLGAVLGEILERPIGQQAPELVHPAE